MSPSNEFEMQCDDPVFRAWCAACEVWHEWEKRAKKHDHHELDDFDPFDPDELGLDPEEDREFY